MEGERWVDWPALLNARDLGGLPAGASTTRSGAIVRADSLASLTDAGLAAMRSHGVVTVVDLRSPGERARWPSPVQGWSGYRARPMFDDAAMTFLEQRFSNDSSGFYSWALESRSGEIAETLRDIGEAPPGGVVIHCGVGKDRTGIVVALLLELAGVDREAILADFLLSGDRLMPLADEEPDPARRAERRRLLQAEPELLTEMLKRLDGRHGGVANYLLNAGVDDATQERLRHRLTSA